MARKRCLNDSEGGDVMVMDSYDTCSNNQHQRDQHQHYQEQQQQQQDDCQQQQQSNKRSCGTAANPAPGQLPADQVAKYLHSLSAHLNNRQLEHASMVLTTEGWQAFAELNLLLSNCLESGMLPGHLMRSYSRFTLQTRAALWQRYSSYVAGKDTLSPQQLELLRFLLEFVLAPYPDCAITEVTLELPVWMVSWASRWGMASSSGRIRLIKLEAYAAIDPCSSRAASAPRQPVRVLYVPALA